MNSLIHAQSLGFLNTPPLWSKNEFEIQQFEFPELKMKTFRAIPLQDNIRFGHQMEYVFKQLIDHSTHYEIIAHNLQIQNNKRTLGEIDFLLRDLSNSAVIHIELTYKFYIIIPEIKEPICRLIGPNRRDSFNQKMQKIKTSQFPLLHSQDGIQTLNEFDINHEEIDHQCCFKAQLFQPFGVEESSIGILNNACSKGFWLTAEDFQSEKFTKSTFYMPKKSEWVIEPHEKVIWMQHDAIFKCISPHLESKYAPMIWMKGPNQKIIKLFVVWW